jgi:murein DD-endopeptidase MepM/ murein hydrolase activator NlpD
MSGNDTGILAHKPLTLTKKRLRWLVLLSSFPLFGMMAAFGIAPDTSTGAHPIENVIRSLELPEIQPFEDYDMTFWRQERIQAGDTIASLLSRLGVNNQDVVGFLQDTRGSRGVNQLIAGKVVHAQTTAAGELRLLRYFSGGSEQLVMEKVEGAFRVSEQPVRFETHIQMKSGVIDSSLFAATDGAGVPEGVATQMVDILSSDIDFHRDLRKGDRFTVVYDSLYGNGEPARPGRVLAMEFINQGTPHRAIYFHSEDGTGGYYAPVGKNMRYAFLSTPLEFSRISSGFSSGRFHPILKTWRAHKGIDYAAPTGTRVKAAANGTVSFAGWKGGYGNVVILQHHGQHSTVYGHLSAFAKGLRAGQRVSQGEVVGYVGATGMATGPHLHYEFLVNGVQRDPTRIAMPSAESVAAKHMPAFYTHTKPLMARLDMLRETSLAFLD